MAENAIAIISTDNEKKRERERGTNMARFDTKPCPFCGCDDKLAKAKWGKNQEYAFCWIECYGCGASTRAVQYFPTTDDDPIEVDITNDGIKKAVRLWNCRS